MEQGNSTSIHKGWYGRGYHPHYDCPGLIQSVGFRLFDSVPAKVVERWLEEFSLPIEDNDQFSLDYSETTQ